MTASAAPLGRLIDSPWPPYALAALAAALGAWMLARLLWLLLAGPALPPPAEPASGPVSAAAPAGLAGWHLFGAPPTSTVRPAAAVSTLALSLRGTLVAADARRSLALIADSQGRERGYRVGEAVGEDAVIEEIHPDHVVLRRAGAREALYLPRATAGGAAAAPAAPRPPPDPSGGYLSGRLHFGAPDLATARQAQTPALEALAASANLLPVTEAGRFVGVRLAVPDPALLERIGLHPDEVITAVNDVPLDDPGRRQALEDSLRGDGPLVLTLRRDGRERRLTVRN